MRPLLTCRQAEQSPAEDRTKDAQGLCVVSDEGSQGFQSSNDVRATQQPRVDELVVVAGQFRSVHVVLAAEEFHDEAAFTSIERGEDQGPLVVLALYQVLSGDVLVLGIAL